MSLSTQADTMAKYASIAKNIPVARLSIKPKAQAWARSARSIFDITEETIAQTIESMQAIALKNQRPIYCMHDSKKLDGALVHQILEPMINNLPAKYSNRTISDVVVEKLISMYPCHAINKANPTTSSLTDRKDYRIKSVRRM